MNQKTDKLLEVSRRLKELVHTHREQWSDLSEHTLRFRPSDEAWSIKEIIGHLIDSASNNHQRFVRLQLVERLTFPDYGQDNIHWVRIQQYQEQAWAQLLDLWRHYNIQLAHIMCTVESACLSNFWEVNPQTRITLFELMTDYLRHLEAHLAQINDILTAVDQT